MRGLFLAAAALALGGCAGGSVYQAADRPGSLGYFVAPAPDGRYSVTYTGNKNMSPVEVAEFAMLRAAELTSSSGQEWFAVIEAANRLVQLGQGEDLGARAGPVLSGGSTTVAGSGGNRTGAAAGVSDAAVPGGPSIGGFGGGDVPYQVVERWNPQTVPQTTIVIQMGSGGSASFAELAKAPEIYSAQAVADEIRAKMNR